MAIYQYKKTVLYISNCREGGIIAFYNITTNKDLEYIGTFSVIRKEKSLMLGKCPNDFTEAVDLFAQNDLGLTFEEFVVTLLELNSLPIKYLEDFKY